MAAITAGMVKELREVSGAGMMDCKKALEHTEGDIDKAVEYLRENGLAKAAKKAGRIAAEGMVAVTVGGDTTAAIVEVNSETDFVAKNDEFTGFVAEIATQILGSSADSVEALMAEKFIGDNTKSVEEVLAGKVAVIGENIKIRRFEKVSTPEGCVVSYVHGGGKIGVLVTAKTTVVNDEVKEALKNVAMQVAALNPKYTNRSEVDQDYIASEKEILVAQAKLEKPDANDKIIEGMVAGRVSKMLKDICLLDQVYVKAEDGKQSVENYIKEVSKKVGAEVVVESFVRFETGEGIEKKTENFAEEVAKQIGM